MPLPPPKIDPITGMITMPVSPETKAKLDSVRRPGETDTEVVARALRPPKSELLSTAVSPRPLDPELPKALRDALPYHLKTEGLSDGDRESYLSKRQADRVLPFFDQADASRLSSKSSGGVPVGAGVIKDLDDRIESMESELDSLQAFAEDHPRIRPVGFDEKVRLDRDGTKFFTLELDDLSRLLGRDIDVDEQGRPRLTPKEVRTIEIALEIRDIVNDADLSPEGRRRVLDELRAHVGPTSNRAKMIAGIDLLIASAQCTEELMAWLAGPLKLGRAQGSAMHKLQEEWRAGRVCVPARADLALKDAPDFRSVFDYETQIFIIEHDWAAAFKGAEDVDGGEIALPFDAVSFEFYISGKRVIVQMVVKNDGIVSCLPVVCASTGTWAMPWLYDYDHGRMSLSSKTCQDHFFIKAFQPVADIIGETVRAVCISLEAEVTETEVVRASHRMNHQRARKGKLPIYDYHIVKLANRSRVAPLPRDPEAEPSRRVRLHFRRGHWRHYAEHKTWIKWMLVGDPDLGWVDKEYRL